MRIRDSGEKEEDQMVKGILIVMALIGALMYCLIVATASPSDREQYEAYLRWKEKRKNERL